MKKIIAEKTIIEQKPIYHSSCKTLFLEPFIQAYCALLEGVNGLLNGFKKMSDDGVAEVFGRTITGLDIYLLEGTEALRKYQAELAAVGTATAEEKKKLIDFNFGRPNTNPFADFGLGVAPSNLDKPFNPDTDVDPAAAAAAKAAAKKAEDERLASLKRAAEFHRRALEEIRKANIDEQQVLKDKYKVIADDETKSFMERFAAESSFFESGKRLIELSKNDSQTSLDFEIEVDKKNSKSKQESRAIEELRKAKQAVIDNQRVLALSKFEIEVSKDTAKLVTDSYRQMADAGVAAYKAISDAIAKTTKDNSDTIQISKDQKLLQLDKDFQDGKIKNVKEFEEKKQQIEDAAAIEELLNDQQRILNDEKIFGKTLDLEKQLADNKVALGAFTSKKLTDQDKERLDKLKELRNQLEDTAQSIVESGFEKKKLKNDAEIKSISDKSKLEIDAINASGLAQEEKVTRVAAVQKLADFQTQQIEKRQKANDLAKAKFEKAASIVRIIQSTKEAFLAALGEKPYTPFNIVQAGIVGAIGLAQLAAVLAQPLPKYKEGTKNAARGLALVSEEGSELIISRSGKMLLTPHTPSLVELAGGETVLRHDITMDMLKHSNMMHMLAKVQNIKQPTLLQNTMETKLASIDRTLRSIEKHHGITIVNKLPVESTAWYRKGFKGYDDK